MGPDDAYRTKNVSFELASFTDYEFMVKVTQPDGKSQLVDFKPLFNLAEYIQKIDAERISNGLRSFFAPPSPPITDPARLLQYYRNGKLWVYKTRKPWTRRKKPDVIVEEESYILGLS